MATYFPEEVISQILLRVHARDLIRIKTVCKLWHSLISNLNFVNAHLARSHPEIILTTCRYHSSEGREDIYDYISIDMQENDLPSKIFQFPASLHNKVYLIHSCNGLTLLQDRDDFPRLYIYNPVTRECNTLSPTQYKCHQWALAYDDSIRKYKVFGIASEKKVCLVLTQGENLWKEVRTIEDPFPVLRSNPVLVEKELCWFSRYMDSLNENIQRLYYVNSIDVATEEFRNIKIPPSITKLCHQLSAVNGYLCLTSVSNDQLDIYVLLDKVNSQWAICYSTNLQSLPNKPAFLESFLNDYTCIVAKRYSCRSSYEDSLNLFIINQNQLFLYELKSGKLRHIASVGWITELCIDYVPHFNSLVRWK